MAFTFPPQFRLYDVSGDRIVGWAGDELGVERVVVYRYLEPGMVRRD